MIEKAIHLLYDAPLRENPLKFLDETYPTTRNILDCDQSNYSSRIILSHIPAKCIHLKFSKMT